MTTPDIIGTVRGYRYWVLTEDDCGLKAIAYDYVWHKGLNTATHVLSSTHNVGHERDQPLCTSCGFYSKYYPFTVSRLVPVGVIENEGDIWLHEWGLRAQRARIVALQHYRWPVRHQMAISYPDARIYWSRRRMYRDYPPASEVCGLVTRDNTNYAASRPFSPVLPIALVLAVGMFVYMMLSIFA